MSEEKPKHPTGVEGWSGTLEELAQAIGKMRYDQVAEFVRYFARHTESEAEKDATDGKVMLSSKLFSASKYLYLAQVGYDQAWKICKPYMKEE